MTSWERLVGEPAAPMVGPFPRAPFLETWHRSRPVGDVTIVGSPDATAAVVMVDGGVRFAGEEHLTDYHSPLGPGPAGLVPDLLEFDRPLALDSIPAEVADPLERGFTGAGASVRRVATEPCMVLDLGIPDEQGWEAVLSSKQRHEVRRKRRRFEEAVGVPRLGPGNTAFGRFVDMHRAAPGDKGDFMTDEMAAFFESLLGIEGARLDTLSVGSRIVAAAFGFEDAVAYYLYNSSFDPAVADASPGIVLVDALLQAESASGRKRFDFLKGTETYKRRLGAVERPLFTLEVTP